MMLYDMFRKLTHDYLKNILKYLNCSTYDNLMTGLTTILRLR